MDSYRVLVVEDHEPLRNAVRDLLESDGYVVSTAMNGLHALQVMREVRPDLILADITMPRMDGYEFYQTVRSNPNWTPIPFIFLTAKADREDILKGKNLGPDDYLTKPFDPQELLVTIRSRLDRVQAIRRSAEVELDELKTQIVTALGHEMRTPLTYIRGYTELALEDIASLSPGNLQTFLLGIRSGSDRMTHLLDDLLLLIRLDTGQTADEFRLLAHRSSNPDHIISEAVENYRATATAQGVLLNTEIAPDLPTVVLCDSLLIDAIGRLIDNGIKFSRSENRIVTVRASAEATQLAIAVSDHGVGIAANDIPLLFQRFRQINRATMEQQGVGAGLAIAQELVKLHGGEITVQSEPAKGSTFTILIPPAE
ncbi:MAG: hybrid sensor histidine kinase/response regulator [Chloroflexi bacterium]|nr:hybrid sensor histidine kinase/response regulator [Chloroflexota bacterium]